MLKVAALAGTLLLATGALSASAFADTDTKGPPPGGFAPDPPPLKTKHQYELGLLYRHGEIRLTSVRAVELPKAVETARRMGRFAVELYVGQELVERVRFDFPLLGADEFAGQKRPQDAPPSFEKKLTTRTTIRVPHSERATKARLVDRATGKVVELPWPPVAAKAGPSAP